MDWMMKNIVKLRMDLGRCLASLQKDRTRPQGQSARVRKRPNSQTYNFFGATCWNFWICGRGFDCEIRNRTAAHRTLFHKRHCHWFFATIPILMLQTPHVSAALLTAANALR